MTQAAQDWLIDGVQRDFIDLTPRLTIGAFDNVPDSLYTGQGASHGFIFSRSHSGGGNTFASSFSENSVYDYCANIADQSSLVRVLYREVDPEPVRNVPSAAVRSCRMARAADPQAQSGNYWLQEGSGSPSLAYCDRASEGGGWTTVFAGRNGSVNVFDHFDSPQYAGACPDPATHCLRRAPASLDDAASELYVSCGGALVKFATTEPVRQWLCSGVRSNWQDITPTLLAGVVPNLPNVLYTGVNDGDQSFILARNRAGGGNAFASSYSNLANYDYCAGVYDQSSIVRVAYREVAPTPIRNLASAARSSCRAIQRAGVVWPTLESSKMLV